MDFDLFIAFLGGLFAICAGVFDWDFFFDNNKARPFVKFFGRNGARIFYIVLGIVLVIAGIALVISD